MLYRVIRPFRQGAAMRQPGQIIELELVLATRLRAGGLVGNVPREKAVARPPEHAVAPGSEHAKDPPRARRKYKPRKVELPKAPEEDPEVGGNGSS